MDYYDELTDRQAELKERIMHLEYALEDEEPVDTDLLAELKDELWEVNEQIREIDENATWRREAETGVWYYTR